MIHSSIRGIGIRFLLLAVVGRVCLAEEIDPADRGSLPVGMTNMEIADEMRDSGEEKIGHHLSGRADGTYVSMALKHPDSVQRIQVPLPRDSRWFPTLGGKSLDLVYYVVYPTTDDNARKDDVFPGGHHPWVMEHMQRPGEKPLIRSGDAPYPLIVISHGWRSHGFHHLSEAKKFASHGYLVAVLFHGDLRVSGQPGSLQHRAVRPLSVRAVLDDLLASPDYRDHIDVDRIGIGGTSFGGATALACLGGKFANRDDFADSRIRAGLGIVPWVGDAFGWESAGLSQVKKPFLHIYGSQDGLARHSIDSMKKLKGDSYLIEMENQAHLFSDVHWHDTFTWELTFFNAYLKGDQSALAALKHGTKVRGYGGDHQRMDHQRIR